MKHSNFFSTTFFILVSLLFQTCIKTDKISKESQHSTPQKKLIRKAATQNPTTLFTRKLFPERMTRYIQHLKSKGAGVQSTSDLLNLVTPDTRKEFCRNHNLDSLWLLVHVELAQLIQLDLSEIDAQMLHFSHWNYQDPFTGEVMNPKILAFTESESVLMDIQGWQAGNYDPLVEKYSIDFMIIEQWIESAQNMCFQNSFALNAD